MDTVEMRALIITHTGFQDLEAHYPYYRLREEVGTVVVMSDTADKCRGIQGTEIVSHVLYSDLTHPKNLMGEELVFKGFDLLVLPGGVKAMEKLRQVRVVTDFIAEWVRAGRPTAVICSGIQLLITAGVLGRRRVTCYPAFDVDVCNANGIYCDEPVVVDSNLVTAQHYRWLAEWMVAAISVATHYPLNAT